MDSVVLNSTGGLIQALNKQAWKAFRMGIPIGLGILCGILYLLGSWLFSQV